MTVCATACESSLWFNCLSEMAWRNFHKGAVL
jgi:hypothetical protein